MSDDFVKITEDVIRIQGQKIEILLTMMGNLLGIVDRFMDEVDLDEFDDEWIDFVQQTMDNGMKIMSIEHQNETIQ